MDTSITSPSKLIFIVRLFPEITIKSAPVRKRWTKLLTQNIRVLGRRLQERTSVVHDWDRIEVRVPFQNKAESESLKLAFIDLLKRTPGIANFSEVKTYPLVDLHDVYTKVHAMWAEKLQDKRFCVRVKRAGQHSFSSTEAERYLGAGLNQNTEAAGVNLKAPDVTVRVDIKDKGFSVASAKFEGMGGFPMGTQDPVMSLVSGGFDSTVASFQMVRRGMRTHYCFFNLGGQAHELAVKEIAYFLWKKYASSHRVKFISVPFDAVVSEIMEKISPANMGVVLKRMMLRAAERVAERGGIEALVTGEAISQVSSQTIPNLSMIDKATDMLVLRPLITTGKPDIIHISREIGAEEFSANVPEYCGVISVKPSAKVSSERLLEEESGFDFAVLEQAIKDCVVQNIDALGEPLKSQPEPSYLKVVSLPPGAKVIDIRHPTEQEQKPLLIENSDVLQIPFYKLNTEFQNLDRAGQYFLYCDRGVMSALHAEHLVDNGFQNVGVYRP